MSTLLQLPSLGTRSFTLRQRPLHKLSSLNPANVDQISLSRNRHFVFVLKSVSPQCAASHDSAFLSLSSYIVIKSSPCLRLKLCFKPFRRWLLFCRGFQNKKFTVVAPRVESHSNQKLKTLAENLLILSCYTLLLLLENIWDAAKAVLKGKYTV